MKTIILCTKCKAELHIVDVRPGFAINEVEISVTVCENPGCCENKDEVDCANCEDLKIWQKRAEVAEEKLQTIKRFFTSDKPAQPAEDDEEPGVNLLRPTEDVVSTGGAIVPGIKEGSANGVKAEYGKLKGDKHGTDS